MTSRSESLNVIALISGGKDSMYCIAHCVANGHRVVALANLSPPAPRAASPPVLSFEVSTDQRKLDSKSATGTPAVCSSGDGHVETQVGEPGGEEEEDRNSFMFQTAGYGLIPLYDGCISDSGRRVPLHRRTINGSAVMLAKEYDPAAATKISGEGADETEDMFSLLQEVKAAHPEADAVCAGAILSTYQRTRVESVALRLNLTPLAWLWMYPSLPRPECPGPESLQSALVSKDSLFGGGAQSGQDGQEGTALLRHMADLKTDARIIKVASAGLDESFLWLNVCDEKTVKRLQKAMGMFGGSVLGEGGEFETLTVSGPRGIWKKRIQVDETQRKVMKGEGGEMWLSFTGGRAVDITDEGDSDDKAARNPAIPRLFDKKFRDILVEISEPVKKLAPSMQITTGKNLFSADSYQITKSEARVYSSVHLSLNYLSMSNITGVDASSSKMATITGQAIEVCSQITTRLSQYNLNPSSIVHVIVLLRRISDFAAFNAVYGQLFTAPLPASRVTVSCGSGVPDGVNILLFLKACRVNEKVRPRKGLHVQSRSYWAPANIGPYSQARAMPIDTTKAIGGTKTRTNGKEGQEELTLDRGEATEAALVYIAGQIPLVPASMKMLNLEDLHSPGSQAGSPKSSSELFKARAVLALQHLWRVGKEQDVSLWTGAVAYLSATSSKEEFASKAETAYHTWAAAHKRIMNTDAISEDDDDEIDVWDRKQMQPSWMASVSMQATSDKFDHIEIPDWDRTDVTDDANVQGIITAHPGFLAVEVDELPRGAEIEWQSHGLRAASDDRSLRFRLSTPCSRAADDLDQNVCEPGALSISTVELRSIAENQHVSEAGEFVHARVTVVEVHEDKKIEHDNANSISMIEVVKKVEARLEERGDKGDAHAIAYATKGLAGVWSSTVATVPCRRIAGSKGRSLSAGILIFEGC